MATLIPFSDWTLAPGGISRRDALRRGGAGLAGLAGLRLSGPAGLATATPVPTAGTPASDAPFPPTEHEILAATLEQAVAMGIVPGAVVGIWIPGRGAFVAASGVGDRSTGAPLTTLDSFRIGSVTKTFTATAVLQLVDDGRIGFDDVLERYVSGVPNGDRATVRQVLDMTAGIPSYTADPEFIAAYEADPLMPFRPRDAIAIAARHAPDFAPGTEFRYSDTNYVALGLLLEQVTGRAAPEVIDERVVAPLGLKRTTFPISPDMPAPFAHGYLLPDDGSDATQDVTRSNPDVASTAGAMVSDLADLRIWAKALADGAQLTLETQHARLTWNLVPSPPGLEIRYGLGVMNIAGFVGHGGNIFGYSVFMGHLPEDDATVVVLTNSGSTSDGNAIGLFAVLAQPLYPDRLPSISGPPPIASPAP